jgi:large subunit ribosomal protein L9
MQAKAKARAMAIALQTIGKFIIKKKVGENDQIFGRCGMRPCVIRG